MPSPDSIHDQSASSVVESGRTEKSKLAHVDGNPQRSDVAHPNYDIVPVPFGLSVRFRTALVLTPNTNDAKGDSYSSIENLAGTGYNDTLAGDAAINTLSGGAGDDVLIGGAGADRLFGSSGTDTASYAGATKGVVANLAKSSVNTNDAKGDTYSSIENLTGSSYADTLIGDASANKLSGGAGDDKLYGGLGKDLLIGGSGKDTFVFDTKLGSTNIDTIEDFSVKDDTIWLDDNIFTQVGKVGNLFNSAFYAGTKAHDASDRIIYDKTIGKLWYDADGTGKAEAIQFAQLDKGLALTASHFDILA